MSPRRPAAAAAALAVVLACARGDALGARDSTFVAAMIELRDLPAGSGADTVARRAILTRRGLTRDSIEAIAAELATDPARAATVWRKIDQGTTAARSPDSATKR